MKKILIVSAVLLMVVAVIAGCDNRPIDQREYFKQSLSGIPELSDCVYIKIDDIRVIRCPNSSVATDYSVQQGKVRKSYKNVTIDGKEGN